MKLTAEFESSKYEVSFEKDGDQLTAIVDGTTYELEVSEPESNVYLFKNNNRIYRVYVAPNGVVNIGTKQLAIKVTDPKKARAAAASRDAQQDGIAEIVTAMPGKIVRVLAQKGDKVSKGDGVIVVEAMKMQNEMKSPKDGAIKEIKFAEGVNVNAGDVLVIIE